MERPFSTLIRSADGGDGQASEALFAALYRELRGVARRELARSGPGAALGVTSLLHEAYLDIAQREGLAFPDRARFFTYAARVMRGLIIDGLRRRQTRKHGGGFEITSIDGKDVDEAALPSDAEEIEQLGRALDELAAVEPEIAHVVDLKFFCGFTFGEIANLRGVSERTVQRQWDKARIYLHQALRTGVLKNGPCATRSTSSTTRRTCSPSLGSRGRSSAPTRSCNRSAPGGWAASGWRDATTAASRGPPRSSSSPPRFGRRGRLPLPPRGHDPRTVETPQHRPVDRCRRLRGRPAVPGARVRRGRADRPLVRQPGPRHRVPLAALLRGPRRRGAATNPALDPDGSFCDLNQHGKVWFLASTFGGVVDRTCEVPAGKAIFLSLGGVFVSFAPEFPAADDPCSQMATDLEKVRCDVNDDVPVAPAVSFTVTLDGEPVEDLLAYRAQSPPGGFTLKVPDPSFLTDLGLDPGDRSPAVADGYFLLLKPLSPGEHTLDLRMIRPGQPETGVNYTLIMREDDDDD